MNRGVLLVVVLGVGLVGAGVLFIGGPLPDVTADAGADGPATATPAEESNPEPTQSDGPDSTGDAGDSNAEGTTTRAENPGYGFTIETIEKCGSTCRDVTARLANSGSETRRAVRVTTKMYAGDDLLWSGNETVGTLDAGESHVSTKRVQVGFGGGMAIKSNDGYVTIVTIIDSASGTTRFSERRKVA